MAGIDQVDIEEHHNHGFDRKYQESTCPVLEASTTFDRLEGPSALLNHSDLLADGDFDLFRDLNPASVR